jgi:hypothetical protein
MILDEETAYVCNDLKATVLERKVEGISQAVASSVHVITPYFKMTVFWDIAPRYSSP